jgi:hypothetical protein
VKEPADSVDWQGGDPNVTRAVYVVCAAKAGTAKPYSISEDDRGVAAGDGIGLGGGPHALLFKAGIPPLPVTNCNAGGVVE